MTFSANMAAYCAKNNICSSEQVVDWLSLVLLKRIRWITTYGNGWAGFIRKYQIINYEKMWFNGLLAATVGLSALATTLWIKGTN